MREIKFRAWDKDENRFWYFALQDILNRKMSYRGSWDDKILKSIKQQYIELKDKNGKEIYEGDILVISGYSYEEPEFECCGEVKYVNCGYCIEDEGEFVNISDFRGSYTTIFKVVGNVYENPELLEE